MYSTPVGGGWKVEGGLTCPVYPGANFFRGKGQNDTVKVSKYDTNIIRRM